MSIANKVLGKDVMEGSLALIKKLEVVTNANYIFCMQISFLRKRSTRSTKTCVAKDELTTADIQHENKLRV